MAEAQSERVCEKNRDRVKHTHILNNVHALRGTFTRKLLTSVWMCHNGLRWTSKHAKMGKHGSGHVSME